jgi:GTP-dependent phosphoenolpyruvate carboxykinase
MYNFFKKISDNRVLIFGSLFSGFVIWRFNKNFDEYARAVSKEKVYDMRRASEQLNLYRELYNPEKDVLDKGPSKLLSVASDEDKEKLKEIMQGYEKVEDPEEIKKQIAKVKQQIEMLEERKTTHQGIKLSRVMHGYEPSEEALKKIREYYRDNKKTEDNQEKKK